MRPNVIFYKTAIAREIPSITKPQLAGIEYCASVDDYGNMGLAVLCCYDLANELPIVFCPDNLASAHRLVDRADHLIGFTSQSLDNQVLAANNLALPQAKCLDLFEEISKAAGNAPLGFRELCQTNFDRVRVEDDLEEWPVWWQRGQIGKVASHCLEDVMLTFRLWRKIINTGQIVDPRDPKKTIDVVLSRFNKFREAA